VETFVQILEHLESGTHCQKPNVDDCLRNAETRYPTLDDGLRVCGARVARGMYTLRNKRNIAHKGQGDPNRYDLAYLLSCAQWIVAELVRLVSGVPMQEAGKLVEQVQRPVGSLVEDFGGRKLVLADLSTASEMLVLLHSVYPDSLTMSQISSAMNRRSASTVRATARSLWRDKLVEGTGLAGYKLTQKGFSEAAGIVKNCLSGA